MSELEELKNQVAEIQKRIERLEANHKDKPTERWKPEEDEEYCTVNQKGSLEITVNNTITDKYAIKYGNAFPKEMEAYLESEHVKILQFHNEMANILWQIDPKHMGKKGLYGFNVTLFKNEFKESLATIYCFSTIEKSYLAWLMLSDEIKGWLES
jgi:hypothetical protein